jgi:hypothetical protein
VCRGRCPPHWPTPHIRYLVAYAVGRYRAELTAEEIANAAGVPVDVITAAEAELPLEADTAAAISAALASLTRR